MVYQGISNNCAHLIADTLSIAQGDCQNQSGTSFPFPLLIVILVGINGSRNEVDAYVRWYQWKPTFRNRTYTRYGLYLISGHLGVQWCTNHPKRVWMILYPRSLFGFVPFPNVSCRNMFGCLGTMLSQSPCNIEEYCKWHYFPVGRVTSQCIRSYIYIFEVRLLIFTM